MEQLEYNLLFRWFVGLSANEPVWPATVFSKNRDRLVGGAVAEEFAPIVTQAWKKKLLSDDHFTVDGTPGGSALPRCSRTSWNLIFDERPDDAIRHYNAGFRIGDYLYRRISTAYFRDVGSTTVPSCAVCTGSVYAFGD